jgi:hypothetical protein
MINSMLNHVALLKPPLPQLNVELVSWYVTKSCFGAVYNIELGGDKVCFARIVEKNPTKFRISKISYCNPPPPPPLIQDTFGEPPLLTFQDFTTEIMPFQLQLIARSSIPVLLYIPSQTVPFLVYSHSYKCKRKIHHC